MRPTLKPQFVLFEADKHSNLIETITTMLHEAYAPLAAKGLRYLATHQSSQITRDRLESGESYLAFLNDELIGTVTLSREKPSSTCEYYRKSGVFSFSQFAIRLSHQGKGLVSIMMTHIEKRAQELGARELALDTSEKANDLILMYEKRGYKHVGHTQWDVTNYRSVIMTKFL